MTEKEKMLRGEYYNSRDAELIDMYHRSKRLLQEYNHLESDRMERREELLAQLLGHKGPGVWIEAPFYCDYGAHVFIGKNTFIHTNCIFLDSNRIDIGEDVLIAPCVQIYTATHPLKAQERITGSGAETKYLTFSKPVAIGNGVWIGGNSVILPGVTIGNYATIGAGSVVTKNIPDGVLALGNPCRIIKSLDP